MGNSTVMDDSDGNGEKKGKFFILLTLSFVFFKASFHFHIL